MIFIISISPLPQYQAFAQEPALVEGEYGSQVKSLMEEMDARERVGQLFLVTFVNDSADPDTLIADLVQNYHIGGVVLLAANNNITNAKNPTLQVATLVNEIQTRAFELTKPDDTQEPNVEPAFPFIPLFVGIDHEGDGFPYTRIISGVTEIPNNMAIGATWNTDHAETVGKI
ncbi:MAG: hypothetical protein JXA42_25010, partial [Anaerolineales bacterium]|nr:hypothetical protein [Anaerolineales bacterium]